MAVYKVIQDIEAEDKLFGPLTLKGFIYAAVAGVLIFIDIRLLISGIAPLVKLLFVLLFLPPMLLFGTLASPLGREQPTEVWLLSHIRFLFKPKTRKWDQSGIKQLVVITAPKKLARSLTKNFTPSDVNSRLQALANTLDSRGWAIKNVAINAAPQPALSDVEENDERLAAATTLAQSEPVLDVHPSDDILDEENNPTARNVQSLMDQQSQLQRDSLQYQLEYNQAENPAPTSEEQALLDRLHAQDAALRDHPPIIRGGVPASPVTAQSQTVKLELANAGNDLSVATIASLAKRNADGGTNLGLG